MLLCKRAINHNICIYAYNNYVHIFRDLQGKLDQSVEQQLETTNVNTLRFKAAYTTVWLLSHLHAFLYKAKQK